VGMSFYLLADIAPFYTEPTFLGGAAAVVMLVVGYALTRKKPPVTEKPEAPQTPEPQSPKERKSLDLAKSSVAAPKEKPSSSSFGGAAQQAESEARKAEDEALRLAAERKRKEEAARKAEEDAKEAEAHLEATKRRLESEPHPAKPDHENAVPSEKPAESKASDNKKLEEIESALQEKKRVAEEAKRAAEDAKRLEEGAKQKAKAARDLAKQELDRAKSVAEGMTKTRESGFIARLGDLFRKKQLNQNLLEEVEEILFTADIGTNTAQKLLDAVQQELSRKELTDPQAVFGALRQKSYELLSLPGGNFDISRAKGDPFVIMVIGVNGVGKTTTIGKLASRFVADDKTVILAAGDTFRAAATEQLEIWGERTACEVVKGKEGSDPSAVVFNAVKRAREVGADVVIADTAGRLHTKDNLMEELKKVKRVASKALEGAPHEVILVLDSTMGQNAVAQARQFTSKLDGVSGIVLTKLDGTAKGGVVLGICDDLKIPVRFIGIGEKVGDLRVFDPTEFVDALFAKRD
jgi:fused signal recognition particle receptor